MRFRENLFAFADTLKGIRNGTLKSKEMENLNETFWWNPYTDDQSKTETPKLTHTRIYSFGNDFYGAIYDRYGRKTLFDCVRHPLKAIPLFREIIRSTYNEQGELYLKMEEI